MSSGYSHAEVLLAVLILAVSLAPALEALRGGVHSSVTQAGELARHHRLTTRLEEVLTQPFADLEAAELGAGGAPTSYSDPVATPDRRLVFVQRYDGDNADGDGNPLTGADDGLLLVRVGIENSPLAVEALTSR